MMDDNRCYLAANPIKSLENARLAVKYGARNALHSLIITVPYQIIPYQEFRLRLRRRGGFQVELWRFEGFRV